QNQRVVGVKVEYFHGSNIQFLNIWIVGLCQWMLQASGMGRGTLFKKEEGDHLPIPVHGVVFHSLGKSPFPPRVVHYIAVTKSSSDLLFKKLKLYVPWHKMDSLIFRNRRDLMFYKRGDVYGVPRF